MTPEQPHAQPPAAPRNRVWTTPRLVLVAFAFVTSTLVFSSSCGPTDDTASAPRADANGNANGNANSNANVGASARTARLPGAAEPVPLPDEIKNAELKTIGGEAFKLADYEGKILVVNLWATWCGPCRDEIPQIMKVSDDYRKRGVEVVGLTMEDDRGNSPEAVEKFVKDFEIKYRVAWAEKEMYATMLAPGFEIPQTYLIDRQGRIRKKFVGGGPHIGNFIRAALDDVLAEDGG